MKYLQIPAAYVRGGTSRAVVFRAADLPAERAEWHRLFARVLGSPDPAGRQLDGFGGGISSLSKVAVLAPASRPGFDVDYHFFQVDPRSGVVQTVATCGNIISAVGPLALEHGWVPEQPQGQEVVIFDVNAGKKVVSCFGEAGRLVAIDGVPGLAPEIRLTFEEPGGAVSGALFPTGVRREILPVESFGPVDVTLIDATLPTVVVLASSLGLAGSETPAELSTPDTLALVEHLRVAAGLRMGLADRREVLLGELANMPDIAVVSRSDTPGAIRVRFFSGGAPHRAAPVTSSIALACSCQLTGTVASGLVAARAERPGRWQLEHPAGAMAVDVALSADAASIASATVSRTARVLMTGHARVPLDD